MADFLFNVAKGPFINWASPPGSSVMRLALLETALVEATVQDADTESAVTIDELDDASYSRGTFTPSKTVDDTNNRVDYLGTQVTFSALAGGETATNCLVIYDPDGTNTNTTNVPVAHLDLSSSVVTNGGDVVVKFNNANPGAIIRST